MNRLPTVFDLAMMALIAAVFLVGCIQIGIWIGQAFSAIAGWIFP